MQVEERGSAGDRAKQAYFQPDALVHQVTWRVNGTAVFPSLEEILWAVSRGKHNFSSILGKAIQ